MDTQTQLKKIYRKMEAAGIIKDKHAYQILLLTNRDSDNVGDQVIEACDIGLIKAVMKNLNIGNRGYKINSRAAAIVSQKYLSTKDAVLLKPAEDMIKDSDLVIFGGAPMFNYQYQNFYERTAVTLELAEKHGVPVIFSAIGVEGYDEDNEKCQRLKKTLNFDCVKQITTRDDFESLRKFKANENMMIDKVSDPAVFTSKVFERHTSRKSSEKQKVGIFVLRANGFKDNKVNFSKEDAADLWKNLILELEQNGYDYELLTSGHFGDEAFLDRLIRKYNFKENKCVFNMNSPEALIGKISSYDAVISSRLHPSIISFSLNVPSVGIVWNSKVEHFYNSIGYGDRIINVNDIAPEVIVEKVKQSIEQGIEKDKDYLSSVYSALFYGIRDSLCLKKQRTVPYTYEELMKNIPAYRGTSKIEQERKLERKFRRIYGKYNSIFEKNTKYRKRIKELKGEIEILKEQ